MTIQDWAALVPAVSAIVGGAAYLLKTSMENFILKNNATLVREIDNAYVLNKVQDPINRDVQKQLDELEECKADRGEVTQIGHRVGKLERDFGIAMTRKAKAAGYGEHGG